MAKDAVRVDNDVTDCCVKTGVWVTTCKWCTQVSFKKQTCKFFCIILSIIQGHELKSFPVDEVRRLQDSQNAPSLSTYRLLVLLPRCSWWPYPDASTMMSVWWCPCHDPHKWCSYHAVVPLMSPHHDSPIILPPQSYILEQRSTRKLKFYCVNLLKSIRNVLSLRDRVFYVIYRPSSTDLRTLQLSQ